MEMLRETFFMKGFITAMVIAVLDFFRLIWLQASVHRIFIPGSPHL